jgi:dienelactone hydrolase
MEILNSELRSELFKLLGDMPDRDQPVQVLSMQIEERETYILETLLLQLNGTEPVPAYFVRPKVSTGKLPVIVFNHSHGGQYQNGKNELLNGASYLESPSYAEVLTGLGYAAISIDAWGFGERSTRTESAIYKEMLWKGQVMWGMMVFDSIRVIDYLSTRADVDVTRMGTLGMSMGGTMAWWLTAMDERIQYCVSLCGLADAQSIIDTNALDCHGIYYYVPSLLKRFETAQIVALIAPREHLCLIGQHDRLSPGVDKIDRELRRVYAAENAADAWRLREYPVGHEETKEMREEIRSFLMKHV